MLQLGSNLQVRGRNGEIPFRYASIRKMTRRFGILRINLRIFALVALSGTSFRCIVPASSYHQILPGRSDSL